MATKAGRYDEVLFSTHGTSGTIKAMNADTVQVEVFQSDGTTNATLYDDRDKTAYSGSGSIVEPDSAGNIEFFADPGIYVLKISDDGTVLRTDTVNVSVDGVEAADFPSLSSDETVTGAWTLSDAATINVDTLRTKGPVFDVMHPDFGAVGDGSTDDTSAINAAITAADSAGGGIVYLPRGTFVTSGIDLAAKDCTLIGQGSQATVIKAAAGITGYVISIPTNWAAETPNGAAPVPFGGFQIQGTGSADATKATGGLKVVGVGNIRVFDIGIISTGGPCLYTSDVILALFDNVTLNRPVGADTNDVPYWHSEGVFNGNTVNRLGLRSVTTDADGSSAVLVEDDGTYTAEFTSIRDPWVEFLHTPENGSVFDLSVNGWLIDEIQLFDSVGASGNSDSRVVTFRVPAGGTPNFGGNKVHGTIPGDGQEATSYSYGVVLSQSRNRVVGTKGFDRSNVMIDSGVGYSYIELGGSHSGTDVSGAVVDNSGVSTNTYIDWQRGTMNIKGVEVSLRSGNFDVTAGSLAEAGVTLANKYAPLGSAARVYLSSAQSISNDTPTKVSWDAESYDDDAMHDNATNPTRITLDADGIWALQGGATFDTNATGDRLLVLRVNTVIRAIARVPAAAGDTSALTVCTEIDASASNYVELEVRQDSGGALNLLSGEGVTWMSARRVR